MILRTVLVVAEPFPRLTARRVGAALAEGLHEGGWTTEVRGAPVAPEELRRSRAVVIAAAALDERALVGSATFELATAARQSGIPAYAVTAEDALDPFDARMLDLQAVLQARTARGLASAGARLATLI